MGVHLYRCNNTNCNHVHYQYHSCGIVIVLHVEE
ncbi:MAG: hypothetical protein IPK61_07880 [Saprospiraceae bacterium]|nr:hypothetical protein [Saprospiraceae bacterium]